MNEQLGWTLNVCHKLTFRNQSQAYEICIRRDLVKEQVFILGRMGNAKQALAIIINKLGDIEEVPPVLLFWNMNFF